MGNVSNEETPKKVILAHFVEEFSGLIQRYACVASLHFSTREEIIHGVIHLTGYPQHVRFAFTDTLGGNATIRCYQSEFGTPASEAEVGVEPANFHSCPSSEIARKAAEYIVAFLLNPN